MGDGSKLVQLVRRLNNFYLSAEYGTGAAALPFFCQGRQVGLVLPDVAAQLPHHPTVFTVTGTGAGFHPSLDTPALRTAALERVLLQWRQQQLFPALAGWRGEQYETRLTNSGPVVFSTERAATPLLGLRAYGVHITGWVRHSSLGRCVWLQRRSSTKQTYPGKLDNFVGGGLAAGLGVRETAVKEAWEEAGVPTGMANRIQSAGTVSLLHQSERGIHSSTEFVFDLELPESFQPGNTDGEVESFTLVPASSLLDIVCSDDFKITSSGVMVDWLVRQGLVTIDTEPELPLVVELLHTPLHTMFQSRP